MASNDQKKRHAVTLMPGDWIGPETTTVAREAIAAAGVEIDWHVFEGPLLTEELLEDARQTGVVLKAKLDAPRDIGHLPPTVQLRMKLGTWATIRPVKALPGIPARFPDIDLVVIRETSEDIYAGLEHEVSDGVYEAVKVTTQAACERISRYAFEYARKHGRRHVTIVHKSNIMKKSDGLFLRTAQAVAKEYPDIGSDEVIVDALCMRLVRKPSQFDLLLCGNLFGDIVSDLCSGLAGGMSASPSTSIGDNVAIFEVLHGKAPGLVGRDKASPMPMLLAGTCLLRHLGENEAATRLQRAIEQTAAEGILTSALGGSATTSQVRDAVIARLG